MGVHEGNRDATLARATNSRGRPEGASHAAVGNEELVPASPEGRAGGGALAEPSDRPRGNSRAVSENRTTFNPRLPDVKSPGADDPRKLRYTASPRARLWYPRPAATSSATSTDSSIAWAALMSPAPYINVGIPSSPAVAEPFVQ